MASHAKTELAERYRQPFVVRRRAVFHGIACVGALWLSTPSDLSCCAALVLVLLGLLVRLWALSYIHKDGEVTTSGPYAVVRHPLYVGNALMVVGLCLAANNLYATLLVLAALAPVYWATMRFEERKLTGWFGAEYTDYARRVPALIPRLGWHPRLLAFGPVRRKPISLALHVVITLLFLGLFAVKEDALEHRNGVEQTTVWGVGIPPTADTSLTPENDG